MILTSVKAYVQRRISLDIYDVNNRIPFFYFTFWKACQNTVIANTALKINRLTKTYYTQQFYVITYKRKTGIRLPFLWASYQFSFNYELICKIHFNLHPSSRGLIPTPIIDSNSITPFKISANRRINSDFHPVFFK